MLDIHDYGGRYRRALRLLREDSEISEDNRKDILDFAEYCQAQGLQVPSIVRHIFGLRKAARVLGKPFKDADKADIVRLVAEIERSTKRDSNGKRTT
jgi:hypothetical protein